ncbi:MAG: hypothetical protein RBT63_02240 [Bdellovibrionales bacterium]|jgi:23S rRNA G2445 N2-methylase RlmL|nr:hypothetical protein [Bdellovibrionales bacterium]
MEENSNSDRKKRGALPRTGAAAVQKNSKIPRVLKLAASLSDETTASFFAVMNPGLEAQARREVETCLGARNLEIVTGGIQFESTWGLVRRGQPKLRTISRVLVRVDQFGVRDFQKLHRKIVGLPWASWIKEGVGLSVRASSHRSRLRIKRAIEETVEEAYGQVMPGGDTTVLCLVRMEEDICTISLDLSGELLHKRGVREDVGKAPLRETWAAAMVERAFELIAQEASLAKRFDAGWQWVEPMAGTAVFLREALAMNKAGETGEARTYAIDEVYRYTSSNEASAVLRERTGSTTDECQVGGRIDFLAKLSEAIILDRDPVQLKRAEDAFENTHSEFKRIRFHRAELNADLSVELDQVRGEPVQARFVIVNPPWGKRLKGKDSTGDAQGQVRLMEIIDSRLMPRTVGFTGLVVLIVPRISGGLVSPPNGWVERPGFEFRAGGIPVVARYFVISR